jgi:hypothetical protein
MEVWSINNFLSSLSLFGMIFCALKLLGLQIGKLRLCFKTGLLTKFVELAADSLGFPSLGTAQVYEV